MFEFICEQWYICSMESDAIMKKNNVILIILIVISLVSITLNGILIFNLNKPKEAVQEEALSFVINDYSVFQSDKLEFRFIIAEMTVYSEATEEQVVSLADLSASGTSFNQITNYTDAITEAGGNLDGYAIQTEDIKLTAKNGTAVVLFIPINDNSVSYVSVTYKNAEVSAFAFNLNDDSRKGDLSLVNLNNEAPGSSNGSGNSADGNTITLQGTTLKEIVNTDDFRSIAADGTQSTVSPISSSGTVYALSVTLLNPDNLNLTIQSVVLNANNIDEYKALDETYQLDGYTNLMDQPLANNTSGVYFFETYLTTVADNAANLVVTVTFSNQTTAQFKVTI